MHRQRMPASATRNTFSGTARVRGSLTRGSASHHGVVRMPVLLRSERRWIVHDAGDAQVQVDENTVRRRSCIK